MLFLKVTTKDGNVEFLNQQKILSVKPLSNGNFKILMGAGLYWEVKPNIEFVLLAETFK
jgi:hypothetical protein